MKLFKGEWTVQPVTPKAGLAAGETSLRTGA